MIGYPRGWQEHLLRRSGGLAATLHVHLTRNGFRPGERTVIPESLDCLPSRKPFRWFRNPHLQRLAFVSQETQVFLQIALTVCLRSLRMAGPDALDKARLVLPDLPFPAIGWRKGPIQVMLCRRYPSQGLTTFRNYLEAARKAPEAEGRTVRWVVPHTLVFPKPARLGAWPEVDASSLAYLLHPELEEAFFFLDLAQLYRHLLASLRERL